jgi:hypothetical protein
LQLVNRDRLTRVTKRTNVVDLLCAGALLFLVLANAVPQIHSWSLSDLLVKCLSMYISLFVAGSALLAVLLPSLARCCATALSDKAWLVSCIALVDLVARYAASFVNTRPAGKSHLRFAFDMALITWVQTIAHIVFVQLLMLTIALNHTHLTRSEHILVFGSIGPFIRQGRLWLVERAMAMVSKIVGGAFDGRPVKFASFWYLSQWERI